MSRALVLGPDDLVRLDGPSETPFARIVVPFQISPRRREDLARRWPAAELVVAAPQGEGPWQARVTADLARLEAADVALRGVPLLDCFRAAWRDDLAWRRALEHAVGGVRRVLVASEGAAAGLLRDVAARGGLDEVEVAAGHERRSRSPSILARLRRAGPRGVALALASRLDPAGLRRAAWRPAPRVERASALAVSSYVNATRAAFEALAILRWGPALHVRSGPGALGTTAIPEGVHSLPLAAALALERREARRAVASAVEATTERLARLATRDPWCPWAATTSTSFRRALAGVLVPEVAAGVVGLEALFERSGAESLAVGDEFAFVDRAALHLARTRGHATASRQHGVLDSHYRRDRVLAGFHVAWDEATVAWLGEHGALGAGTATRVEARRLPALPPTAGRGRDVVVFLQPLEFVGVPTGDWLRETIPPLARAAAAAGVGFVGKPHPLQSRAALEHSLQGVAQGALRLVTDRSARDLLATCAVAVTLDSSVAVDCREAGVPCLSTAWYDGTYARDLARLGWVQACESPQALEARVGEFLRAGSRS